MNLQNIRERFHYMRGNILVMTVTLTLGSICRGMVFPYASLYILALGGDPAQIGWINALKPLAGLLMFPIGGFLTDTMGRTKLVAYGSIVSGSILLLYVVAPSWEIVALAGLLQGFMVFSFPASSALLADSLSPLNRAKGHATMNTIAGALAIFSPYIAGAILDAKGDKIGMRILYTVMMVAYLATAWINFRYLKETAPEARTKVDWSALPQAFKQAYGGVFDMLRSLPKSLHIFAIIIVLSFSSNAIAGSFWVVYAKEHIGLSATTWGSILLVETLLRILLMMPAGMAVDKYGRTRFILAALVLSGITVPLFVFTTTPMQVLLVRIASAIANAFFLPACAALMADYVPQAIRGRVMAAIGRGTVMLGPSSGGTGGPGMGFLITLPVMLGSIAGGYLYEANPAWPYWFVTGATAISIVLTILYLRDPQQAHD